MVTDDEAKIRSVLAEMLAQLGFESFFAPDGNEAIRLFREAIVKAEPYDAVIFDLTR